MSYLQGERIKLFKFSKRYIVPRYVDWLNDPEINRFLHVGQWPITTEEIQDHSDRNNLKFAIMCNYYEDANGELVSDDTEYPEFVGTISLHDIDWVNRRAETGYIIGSRKHWGLGLATEAVGLVTNYALERLNLNKIEAGVIEGNIGSIKVLEKCGYKEYGVIPEEYFLDGKYYASHRFYKLQGWK